MEESRMVLRVILVEQVDLVKDLWLELAEHHWRRAQRIAALASPVTPEVSWSMRRAQYESWAPEPGWLLLGAELDGRIVGYAASRVVPVASSWDFGERMGKLETLVIQPGMRGRGAGRQLFDAVRRHWRALGVAYGSVSVMAENSDAVGFYESLGAVEHSRIFCYPALRRPCYVPHQRPVLGRPDQQRRGRRRDLNTYARDVSPNWGHRHGGRLQSRLPLSSTLPGVAGTSNPAAVHVPRTGRGGGQYGKSPPAAECAPDGRAAGRARHLSSGLSGRFLPATPPIRQPAS
jgi:ribosomal protein S18 acetylase RimI-like enzyme